MNTAYTKGMVIDVGCDGFQGGRDFVATIWNKKGQQIAIIENEKFAKYLTKLFKLKVEDPFEMWSNNHNEPSICI